MFKNRKDPNKQQKDILQKSPNGPSNSEFHTGVTSVEFSKESNFSEPEEKSRYKQNYNNANRVEFASEFDECCDPNRDREDNQRKNSPNEGESLETRDRNDSPYYDVT